jgi:YcxB-like protein
METSFTLSREDFSRFQKLLVTRLRRKTATFSSLFIVQVIAWLFVGLAGSSFFRLLEQHPEMAWSLGIFGFFTCLALLTMLALPAVQQRLMCKHMLLANGAFLSPQTIRLSATALTIEAARGKSELLWPSILAVEQDAHNYYLFVDAMQAVILPKSALAPFRAELEARLSVVKEEV